MANRSFLPRDLIVEILSRLPVKSLLRFKTLCRFWFDLISSSGFIASHLGRSKSTSSLLLTSWGRYDEAITYGISLLDDELAMLKHQDLPFQATKRGNIFSIVGCCNGLVCVSLENDGADCVLWNPATRQYRHIPPPLIPVVPNHCFVRWGFGFHPETNKHKLLRIVQSFDQEKHAFPRSSKYTLRTEIFTLSTGSWREINGIPPCICQDSWIAVAVKGVQHRIVNEGWSRFNGGFVLSFDMGMEQFSKMEVPPNCRHNKRQKLLPFQQLLAMLVWTPGYQSIFDMWTMKNDSWTKLFVVGPFPKPVFAIGVWRNCEILVCPAIKEGDDTTLPNDRLLLFDTLTKITREVPNGRVQFFHEGGTYVESLLSVYTGF